MEAALSHPTKLLLLTALLAKDHIISNNAKSFLKELILRRDPSVYDLLSRFEDAEPGDASILDLVHNLIADEAYALYNELFHDTSLEVGKTLSKDERDVKGLVDEKSLIYGEVEFNSFYRVLRKINPLPGGIFYDLGSGTGKAIMAARFTCDFDKCIGIEILEGLHKQAQLIVQRYNAEFQRHLSIGQNQLASVYHGSFLDYDWSDGDVVFANSTCFDDQLMLQMSRQAALMKPGSIFVSFTKGLITKNFEVLERKRYRMSWGPATVFIHRRLPDVGKLEPYKLNILPSDAVTYEEDEYPAPMISSDEEEEDEADEDEDDDGERVDSEEEEDADDEEDAEDDGNSPDDDDNNSDNTDEIYSKPIGYTTYSRVPLPSQRQSQIQQQNQSPPSKLALNTNPLNRVKNQAALAGLGSPQDAALLKRKHHQPHYQPVSYNTKI